MIYPNSTRYKFPPVIFLVMLSGVPLLNGDGVEDLAVCKRSNAVQCIVFPHHQGHTVFNPVPRPFRAHLVVSRLRLLHYRFRPFLRVLHFQLATTASRMRPATRTRNPWQQ